MKQEVFKKMYTEIKLDKGQKERIWNYLEEESETRKNRTRIQRGSRAPVFAAICVCIILVIGVPVLAANSSVIQRLMWSFGSLSGTEQNLTEEQKEIYTKYGSELKNEIVMDDIILKLEAIISDEHNICIPFSLNFEKASFSDVVEEGIKEGKFLSVISAQMPKVTFVFKDAPTKTGVFTLATVLDSSHQEGKVVSGCYLLTCHNRAIKRGDVIEIIDNEKWEKKKAENMYEEPETYIPVIDEITIDKVAKSQNISVENIQKEMPEGVSIKKIKLSPLSLTIEGSARRDAVNQSVFNAGCEFTIQLRGGKTVKETVSTGPQLGSLAEEGDSSAIALLKAPINLDDVTGIQFHSDYYGSYDLYVSVGEGKK